MQLISQLIKFDRQRSCIVCSSSKFDSRRRASVFAGPSSWGIHRLLKFDGRGLASSRNETWSWPSFVELHKIGSKKLYNMENLTFRRYTSKSQPNKKEVIAHSPYIVNMRITNAIPIAHIPNILAILNQINGLDSSLMDWFNGGIATNPRPKNRTAHTISPIIFYPTSLSCVFSIYIF